ncbi:hypothetical protein Nepgr_019492 [Nepenthes gracilis]|uniref:GTPase Der n=1 Tax=Nepenthes gracilis TaxID=150966 RepID=A0AAD3SVF3_NEPGR|nr:hypothetical protein Nepgr_019492 [Nepenthes gracilis]
MSNSWLRALSPLKRGYCGIISRTVCLSSKPKGDGSYCFSSLPKFCSDGGIAFNFNSTRCPPFCHFLLGTNTAGFCALRGSKSQSEDVELEHPSACNHFDLVDSDAIRKLEPSRLEQKPVDFSQIDKELLPTVLIVGRPNVGKSALFNRLIRRREAIVYNTPDDHVTRDIREGIAKLGDLRFRVLDSAGLEAAASSGSILGRTAEITANILSKSQFAIFLIAARDGLQPMDLQVGKWLRRHAQGISTILVMNKSESLDDGDGSLTTASGEAYRLGFGDPIPISAETGFGMAELYGALRPLLEEYMVQVLNGEVTKGSSPSESEDSKLPLQLAIVGRPNVGKSTLLNTLLQEDRVLVGPEAGLTRDSIRAQFQYEGRTIYMVDTAGWLERTKQEKGPASLSIMQTRKNLMRAQIVVLVLDAEEIAKARRSMKHAEVVIARHAVEEGRGLVVVVNKMDLLKGRQNSKLYDNVTGAVPQEIQKLIPQVTGIPVVFVSALEGRGRKAIMRQVIETYEKWCLRLSTARLNRWLCKVMSRHSWKDQATQAKIKYFTQVKGRPPTFVAFVKGSTDLSDTEIRFLTKSLMDDFNIGGIPIRILQRSLSRKDDKDGSSMAGGGCRKSNRRSLKVERAPSDKRRAVA